MFNQLLLGNKPTSLENMKSYFLTSVLITQSVTLISQPLFHNLILLVYNFHRSIFRYGYHQACHHMALH
ncbi:hypothetical protein EX290_04765 [Enterococcus faecium]|uniref:Uncharacterized protein n=1 Tax=Enterococcus faecium TaxID=1352 RepID=A0AB74CQS3_ENTFC|nr:hypothetical protein [Enterococcus faecium]MBO1092577.1 hypothetical protein [Enterococcus lactis]MSS53473.1 hypothetical protein [Enterococcus sp. WCA-130-P53-23F]MSS65703.1 hypothetical protein [Enterococcus sp. BSM-130-P53-22D]RAX32240.1 hypothetical protein DQE80_00235 [Enterococcus sp. HPCN18]HAW88850.1 hypothetical protein [Enterococcus sp.]